MHSLSPTLLLLLHMRRFLADHKDEMGELGSSTMAELKFCPRHVQTILPSMCALEAMQVVCGGEGGGCRWADVLFGYVICSVFLAFGEFV